MKADIAFSSYTSVQLIKKLTFMKLESIILQLNWEIVHSVFYHNFYILSSFLIFEYFSSVLSHKLFSNIEKKASSLSRFVFYLRFFKN